MLSRRNIRVKVMQTLYSVESMNHETRDGEPLKILNSKIKNTQEVLAYLIFYITEVAAYAEKLSVQRAQKLLPSESDLSVSTKIAGNEVVWKLLENNSFKKATEEFKTRYLINSALVRKLFLAFSDQESYKSYIAEQSRNGKIEKDILELLFEMMLENEEFLSEGEEKFIHWNDDMEVAVGLVKTALSRPASIDFLEMPDDDKMQFARDLLKTVIEKNEYCLSLIEPKLQNWEADRIAVIDMILLKMGVCEILYFETIPTKVTLNEYIDIAKDYSTEKSGHFVNGILDNIYKELESQNKVHKVKFKKTF